MEYGVIGEKLSHSFSKEIHALFADYDYEIAELKPEELPDFFKKRDFLGINVTIPYKSAVIPYIDILSKEANELKSVNTVINKNGILYGYNTDYTGFEDMLIFNGVDLKDKKILILGSGGTSKTVKLLAENQKAKQVFIVSRQNKCGTISYEEAVNNHKDAEIIINATPVGMYPENDGIPLDLSQFNNLCAVIDAVYNPINTNFVLSAKAKGIKAFGGLYMLVSQAKYASELFLGEEIKKETVKKVYEKIRKTKENIVLTGMPSSGKTTVGRILAKELNRVFIDTDAQTEKEIGISIKEYIQKNGEEKFREKEREVISKISKSNSLVIATGGGSVLNETNLTKLRQNGVLYFLDRSLDKLSFSPDRPLSDSYEKLKKLYSERYGIYKNSADVVIDGNRDALSVANDIKERYI